MAHVVGPSNPATLDLGYLPLAFETIFLACRTFELLRVNRGPRIVIIVPVPPIGWRCLGEPSGDSSQLS
jgi:hypothetical protein